ncbi:MAG: TnpV protein [Lachnospiraceae bacterium]|nr:TnpV protein [Lachnospiraceae bacterium]
MRKRFLEENHRGIYSYMILSETLWKHLAEIDEECNEMMDRLVRQMAKKEGVTEQLKSDDWLLWLQKMNGIRSRAEEVVLHDLIYSL